MAWTSPVTRVTGEIVTAASWNVDVRDNLRALKGMDGLVTIQDGITMSGTGTASYLKPPVLTTTQRDAIASPANGMVIFNSDTIKLERYEGQWNRSFRRVYSSGTVNAASGTAETTLKTAILGTLGAGNGVMLWVLYLTSGTSGTSTFRLKINGTTLNTYAIPTAVGNNYRPYQAMLNRSEFGDGTSVYYCILAGGVAGGTGMYSTGGEMIQSLNNGTLTITGQNSVEAMATHAQAMTVIEYP